MNVLSLFDGMSCGMIALERAGIQVDNYYASEIDKYCIKVSAKNYPQIIRLGDVRFFNVQAPGETTQIWIFCIMALNSAG